MIEIQALASGSTGNCYRVTDGSTAPPGVRYPISGDTKGLHFRVSEVAVSLVSHEHQDHSKAVRDVMSRH